MESASPWHVSPNELKSEPDHVHVFRLALDPPASRLAALAAHLSDDERERAARFLRECDRQRFTAAHGQVREILAAYLDADPAGLRFTYNPQGKPDLAQGEPHFNLSHSLGMGLLAVAFQRQVGVDVERLDRAVDYANIARRFFAPVEVAEFFALPLADRPLAFCTGWTRKEAYIKARGMGLSISLDSFAVNLAPGQPPRLTPPDPGWSIHALDPGDGFVAALVVEGEIKGIRCWDWG